MRCGDFGSGAMVLREIRLLEQNLPFRRDEADVHRQIHFLRGRKRVIRHHKRHIYFLVRTHLSIRPAPVFSAAGISTHFSAAALESTSKMLAWNGASFSPSVSFASASASLRARSWRAISPSDCPPTCAANDDKESMKMTRKIAAQRIQGSLQFKLRGFSSVRYHLMIVRRRAARSNCRIRSVEKGHARIE